MRALKGIVFLMTVAIVVLMTMLIYGMYQKSKNPDFKFFNFSEKTAPAPATAVMTAPSPASEGSPTSALPVADSMAPGRAFGDLTLPLPAGATIQSATVSGNRMVVITANADGTDPQVWVLDLASGQVMGRVKSGAN